MKFIQRASVKTKLLMLVLPSSIFFLIFAGITVVKLYQSYKTVYWNRAIRNYIDPYFLLNRSLQEENSVSRNFLLANNSVSLEKTRHNTNIVIHKFLKFSEKIDISELDFLKIYNARIKKELSKISSIRQKIDNHKISLEDIHEYFVKIELICFDAIGNIDSLYKIQKIFTKPHKAFIYLLKETHSFQRLTSIIEKSLNENTITVPDIIKLSKDLESEKIYQKLFLSFANKQQRNWYEDAMNSANLSESDEIIKTILSKNINGNFNIPMNQWLVAKSDKLLHFSRIRKKIEAQLGKSSKAQMRKSLITLSSIAIFVLIVFILNIYLVRLIFLDIVNSIKKLSEYSSYMEKKDLTKAPTFTYRVDEFGELEKSFSSVGESLKQIIFRLKSEIDLITKSSSEILNAITQFSSEQKETENAIVESNATMEELKQSSAITMQKSEEVANFASETIETLRLSVESIQKMVNGLNDAQSKMDLISDNTTKLNEQTKSIETIIESVNDIAEQSHILAVNASIEAAKAGEHGKGFSIVAMEVRNLAEQSKQATAKIHNILKEIQNAMNSTVLSMEQGTNVVKKGVEQSSQITNAIDHLTKNVETVSNASKDISSASKQQFTAVSQTTTAITNIKSASLKQGDQTKQIEENVGKLHTVSENLSQIIHEFQLPINASNGKLEHKDKKQEDPGGK